MGAIISNVWDVARVGAFRLPLLTVGAYGLANVGALVAKGCMELTGRLPFAEKIGEGKEWVKGHSYDVVKTSAEWAYCLSGLHFAVESGKELVGKDYTDLARNGASLLLWSAVGLTVTEKVFGKPHQAYGVMKLFTPFRLDPDWNIGVAYANIRSLWAPAV